MILLCTILKVVNGKSFFASRNQLAGGVDWREGLEFKQERYSRTIRQILNVKMTCPSGMKHARGRCRKILVD